MPAVARRAVVIAVAILVADLAVAVVDHDFSSLGPRDFTRGFDRRALRWMMRSVPTIAFAENGPLRSAFDYMLVCHSGWC